MGLELDQIKTEQRNPLTEHIDELSTLDMVTLINSEDHKVAEAVKLVLPEIASAVDLIADRLSHGGRLVYIGCGTSGRLGILDASECPPTFNVSPELVQGLIAGGATAILKAVEGAEDSRALAVEDMKHIDFCDKDVLCGLAASGRTPYVLGGMEYASSIGAQVIAVTCCKGSAIDRVADIGIAPEPGPEVVTGSTRLKSGTAQKMVLNMLTTGAMIRMGKVYGNLMVDVQPTNEKLIRRCQRFVMQATGVSEEQATAALDRTGYRCKEAIVTLLCDVNTQEAIELLKQAGGRIADVLKLQREG
ncbi:MAG: N-acetylmuramic acid 6-phosphate etherase [Eubacteriales bacterium]|nr:N-acetylmuramic acid 6-phosphate etherase [Eubacteriales bacterium]